VASWDGLLRIFNFWQGGDPVVIDASLSFSAKKAVRTPAALSAFSRSCSHSPMRLVWRLAPILIRFAMLCFCA
jgi:hypothetical protein